MTPLTAQDARDVEEGRHPAAPRAKGVLLYLSHSARGAGVNEWFIIEPRDAPNVDHFTRRGRTVVAVIVDKGDDWINAVRVSPTIAGFPGLTDNEEA